MALLGLLPYVSSNSYGSVFLTTSRVLNYMLTVCLAVRGRQQMISSSPLTYGLMLMEPTLLLFQSDKLLVGANGDPLSFFLVS